MNESSKKAKKGLRGGAALTLALLLLASPLTLGTRAVSPKLSGENSAKTLIPVGRTIGIKLFARGVLVVGLSDGVSAAKTCGLREGDQLLQLNEQKIESTEQLQSLLQAAGDDRIALKLRRGSGTLLLHALVSRDKDGTRHLGAWIRDSMAGIGTMTFYDPETGAFGALGHGITDSDTGQLMPLSSGAIMESTVKAVHKGESGKAGELRGDFDLKNDLGKLSENSDCGVFGTVENPNVFHFGQPMPVAAASEVKTGKASMLCNVSDDQVEEFDIEISRLYTGDTRNLLVTVTDPRLLAATGGIVQGMSGSPILQNGKLAGAVTHVLLGDPTRGYGILMENMLASGEETAAAS